MTTERMSLRYRLAGGVLGLSLAASLGISAGLAQEDEATPDADATPAVESVPDEEAPTAPEFDIGPEGETRLVEQIQQVGETIEAVRADRDAAGVGDTATVDQLLERATGLLDQAQQALDAGTTEDVPRQTMAAQSAAMAAEALLRAQLSDYGLPSQQAGASRTLDTAYRQIKDSTERTADQTDENVTFFVTTAQELYRQAYDLYNAGTFARAAETARVGAGLGRLAELLTGDTVVFADPAGKGVVKFAEGRGGVVEVHRGDRGHGPWEIGPAAGIEEIRPAVEAGVIELRPFHEGQFDAGPSDFSTENPIEVPEPEF